MSLPNLEELKKLRKELGLTQSELAKKAGVSQPLIARIESLDVDPRLSTFRKIYETLEEIKKEKISAEEVMHFPVVTVSADSKLRDTIEIMSETDFSQLPVVEDGTPVGSISESNILNEIEISDPNEVDKKKVKDCMGSGFPTVSPSTDIKGVVGMLEHTPAVLVMDKGELVGVITKQDIMKVLEGEKHG